MKLARAFWTVLAAVFTGACLSAPDLPYPCAQDGTCPAGDFCANGMGCFAEGSCTPGDDSCGNGERCALAKSGSGTYATACVAASATSAENGTACSQSLPNIDNCGEDAICDSSFSSDGSSACRAFCSGASECGTSEECVALDKTYSVCVPTCTSVNACGDSATCRLQEDGNGVCESNGTAGLAAPCSVTQGCAAGLECRSENVCIQECDANEACPAGQGCNPVKPSDPVGFCGCDPFTNECGPNATCRFGDDAPTCTGIGNTDEGGVCNDSADCGENQFCASFTDGSKLCVSLCDPEHPCTNNVSCNTSVFQTSDTFGALGLCVGN